MRRFMGDALQLLLMILVNGNVVAYDYEDIIPYYCHEKMDWGPIPEAPEDAKELMQVQVFIRHGARTPAMVSTPWGENSPEAGNFTCALSLDDVSTSKTQRVGIRFRTVSSSEHYVANEHKERLPGKNCIPGQLVQSGYEMEHANGQHLREAYVDKQGLLPKSIVDLSVDEADNLFFLRSTDMPRTRQSAMALLDGLYDVTSTGTLDHLDLHTRTRDLDSIVFPKGLCPAAAEATQRFWDSQGDQLVEFCEKLDPSGKWKMYLNPWGTGLCAACAVYLAMTMDAIMSRACSTVPYYPHNTTIPSVWFSDNAMQFRKLWQQIDSVLFDFFKITKKFSTGKLIEDILQIQMQAAGGHAPKFVLYSGHDMGPMEPLWAAFDLKSKPPYWPPFASMTVLELWNSDHGPFVRWISNGEVVGKVQTISEFRNDAQALVPSTEECTTLTRTTTAEPGDQSAEPFSWFSAAVGATIISAFWGFAFLLMYRKLRTEGGASRALSGRSLGSPSLVEIQSFRESDE